MADDRDHAGDILWWTELVAHLEAKLGREICGALMVHSGSPCVRRPAWGYRRCDLHGGYPRRPWPELPPLHRDY